MQYYINIICFLSDMVFLTTIYFNNRYGSFELTSINKILCQTPIYVYDNNNLYFRMYLCTSKLFGHLQNIIKEWSYQHELTNNHLRKQHMSMV